MTQVPGHQLAHKVRAWLTGPHRQQKETDELDGEAKEHVEERQVDQILREPNRGDSRDAAVHRHASHTWQNERSRQQHHGVMGMSDGRDGAYL